MALRLMEKYTGERYRPVRLNVAWGPILPQDRGRLVREELLLVQGGLHSRHRAMTALGVQDPALEAARMREEGGGEGG